MKVWTQSLGFVSHPSDVKEKKKKKEGGGRGGERYQTIKDILIFKIQL